MVLVPRASACLVGMPVANSDQADHLAAVIAFVLFSPQLAGANPESVIVVVEISAVTAAVLFLCVLWRQCSASPRAPPAHLSEALLDSPWPMEVLAAQLVVFSLDILVIQVDRLVVAAALLSGEGAVVVVVVVIAGMPVLVAGAAAEVPAPEVLPESVVTCWSLRRGSAIVGRVQFAEVVAEYAAEAAA